MQCRALLTRIVVVSVIAFAAAAHAGAQSSKPQRSPLTNLKLPIAFEPNQGQAPESARYVARAANARVSLRPLGMDFSLSSSARDAEDLSIEFVDASAEARIDAMDRQASESNYILGRDSRQWHTHVSNFSRVKYSELYSGIDLVVYGTGQQFEHDFIVAPGANSCRIKLRLEGAAGVSLSPDGSAKVMLAGGALTLRKPDIYQDSEGRRVHRKGRFVLLAKNELGFAIGAYDHSRPLIIDPVLSYSTFLANSMMYFGAFASDAAGNTYIAGQSFGGYPVTPGAFQQTCASCAAQLPDAVITKLNAEGTAAVYSTYLGGNSYDQPFGIAVDSHGDAIVSGYTESPDFPLKNPVSSGMFTTNSQLAFITSLSPDGSSLNYSSVLGGSSQQDSSFTTWEFGIAVDSSDNAYITGYTDSDSFPLTPGALNNVTPQYPKVVVYLTKFLTDGSLGYSAFLGDASPQGSGSGIFGPAGIAVDSAGSAYITGQAGVLWPTTNGAYQTSITGSMPSGAPFVTKLSSDGSAIVYSTFIGDQGNPSGIAVNGSGEAFFTGAGVSSGYPTTANAYEGPIATNACCPSFVSKLNDSGSELLYSTFLYGSVTNSSVTTSQALALDASGNIWLSGETDDPQFPLAHQLETVPSESGGENVYTGFVTELNPSVSALLFSTFFAGPATGSQIPGIAIDSNGNVHFAGLTGSDLYTTSGAYVSTVTGPPKGAEFGFAASIEPGGVAPLLCISYPSNAGLVVPGLVGTGGSQKLTVTNCGELSLSISSIQSSDPVFTVPANLNGCSQPVAAGASCTLTVNFAPTMSENVSALLTFQSNTPVAQTILPLLGLGLAPEVSVQPSSVSFGPTPVGQTSPNEDVLVGNIGTLEMNVNLAHTTISPGFAFTQIGCDVPVQPQQDCEFSVTFTPTTAGNISGTLNIATDDPVNPLTTVSLSGTATATGFSLGSGGSSSTSETVAAGATATYNLSLTAATGYSGTVTMTCTQVPLNASCNVNPSPITLASGQTANFTVSVATETAAAAAPSLAPRPLVPIGVVLVGLLACMTLALPRRFSERPFRRVAALLMLVAILFGGAVSLVACGGSGSSGNSGGGSGAPQKTPAGTYTLQLQASDGTNSHSESLTLIVQ